MHRHITVLWQDEIVEQALARLRAQPPTGRILYFYVVDRDQRLVGVVPTRRLLLSTAATRIADIMVRNLVAIPETATVMDACEMFTLHKFLALPVVDEQRKLRGVVDIELYTEEIHDLAERTGFDDLFQLVGVHASQARQGSPLFAFRNRFPWLWANILGGVLAAFLSGAFQFVLDQLLVLALFIPVVLSLSESVAIQSVSLTIQALHGRQLSWREHLGTLRRELVVGLLLGVGSGAAVGLVAWVWQGNPHIGVAIASAIACSVAASAVIGLAMPLGVHLLRADPRVAAGPIALVGADLVTLLVYFNLARWWLM